MLHIVFIPGVIGVPGAPRVLLAPVEALVCVVPVEGDASPAHDDGQVPAHQLCVVQDAAGARSHSEMNILPKYFHRRGYKNPEAIYI